MCITQIELQTTDVTRTATCFYFQTDRASTAPNETEN
jgi:hypothetical protein